MNLDANVFHASVTDLATKTALKCDIKLMEAFGPCRQESIDEFFFERYAAFNRDKYFRVSHRPWKQCRGEPVLLDDSLLWAHFPWFAHARMAGANYSPGAREVRMGWPRRLPKGPGSGKLPPKHGQRRAHLRPDPRWAEAQTPARRA
jgi:hypothetical protein